MSQWPAGKIGTKLLPIFDSPNGSEKKKDNPKKMDKNHAIRKNLVEHLFMLT